MAIVKKKKVFNNEIVEESQKTKRARDKLRQRLELMEKKTTLEALKDKTDAIERWIDRRSEDRVAVNKDIPLFDKNQHSAKPSRGVARLQEELSQKLK
jgi:hypothetical protein